MKFNRFAIYDSNREHYFPITLEKALQLFEVARTSEKMVLDSLPYALRAMLIASPEFRERGRKRSTRTQRSGLGLRFRLPIGR